MSVNERIREVVFRALDKAIDRVKGVQLDDELLTFLMNRREAANMMFDAMQCKVDQYVPSFWRKGPIRKRGVETKITSAGGLASSGKMSVQPSEPLTKNSSITGN
ncbi:hypothetical protein Tcan_10881 [Toxocara canis]|uniref:Uncharacterized protein n=2 Tax=Toxocara canis TaxID=6265 RepID=A0A0B2W371_TOXCA|nr:hypothetical protein Tcan_10881 [Toxocara canis]VDM50658.1 unnamed protein product [Toxocara canis]